MTEIGRVSILRLHEELFCLIFRHLSDIYPPGEVNQLGWIVCTHVCQSWRRIGTEECATLWGECLCAFPRASPIFLERARSAKLTVDLTVTERATYVEGSWILSEDLKDTLCGIFQGRTQQLQRVSLSFSAFRPILPAFRAATFDNGNPAGVTSPNIEADMKLRADNERVMSKGQRASLLSGAALDGFMGQTLPALRELEIVYETYQCSVKSTALHSDTAFVAPNLISLKLHRQCIPVHILYDILQSTPLLETLDVQWTHEDGTDMTGDLAGLKPPLSLPQLKNVALSSPTLSLEGLRSFVGLIRAHPDVRLRFGGSVTSHQEAIEFLAMLAALIRRSSLDLFTIRGGRFPLSGTSIVFSSTLASPSNPKPCVDVAFEREGPQIVSLVQQMFMSADYTRIRALRLDVDSISLAMAPDVMSFLAQLTAIQELQVNLSSDGLLLGFASVGQLDAALQPRLFPDLKTLVLRRINLSPSSLWQREGRQAANAFLEARKEAGVPVSKVILRGMKLGSVGFDRVPDDVALRELEEFVDEVVDQRQEQSMGIMPIIADDDFL
ncbi:unnamed protein product [Peniophora sp. CBMAI 1063]|nr:unnamed protein product [Peniophora sp. CBMAI 1063]